LEQREGGPLAAPSMFSGWMWVAGELVKPAGSGRAREMGAAEEAT